MAVEFGAKLYLKDNMYATLKKNLGSVSYTHLTLPTIRLV